MTPVPFDMKSQYANLTITTLEFMQPDNAQHKCRIMVDINPDAWEWSFNNAAHLKHDGQPTPGLMVLFSDEAVCSCAHARCEYAHAQLEVRYKVATPNTSVGNKIVTLDNDSASRLSEFPESSTVSKQPWDINKPISSHHKKLSSTTQINHASISKDLGANTGAPWTNPSITLSRKGIKPGPLDDSPASIWGTTASYQVTHELADSARLVIGEVTVVFCRYECAYGLFLFDVFFCT
ncbi:hypothetical protein EI94DRAFT_1705809 [Lactarius quietus]|nr:hypothetical protein EI94DRAFT_1705809 [Lactarius quietus]